MRALIAVSAAAMLLASCDSGQRQQSQPVHSIKVRSAEQDQLFKLNDLNRAIALRRALYDSGYPCQRMTKYGFVGTYQHLAMWMASSVAGTAERKGVGWGQRVSVGVDHEGRR